MHDRFDLLIFDWDGTLINSIDWIVHCLIESGKALGQEPPDILKAKDTIGLSIHNAMNQLYPDVSGKGQQQLVDHYSQIYFSRPISDADLFQGIKEMLNGFREMGYLMAVATGKNKRGLDHAMENTQMTDFFDLALTAEQTSSKPDPHMLHDIMENLRVEKDKAVMVGDSIHDIQMAHNAGISAIAVSCGANSQGQLEACQPLLSLEHTLELKDILKRK